MKTITIRDLRQRWPEAEAALEVEEEILITRDSKPVAKLVRVVPNETKRPRWNPRLHWAAMEELKVSRLMTHDESQAKAAMEAGFEVIRPGRRI